MNKKRMTRIVSLLLVMMIVVPTMALADIITTGGKTVPAYTSKNYDSRRSVGTSFISNVNTTNEGGWYRVPDSAGGGNDSVYVRQEDVTIVQGSVVTPEPTATATPTPLPPGVTPSPTPEQIGGAENPNYTGTILNYPVPQGGLSVYDKVGGSAVKVIAQGQTLKLSSVEGTDPLWYSMYYGGATYYVPESLLTTEGNNPGTTQQSTKSVVIVDPTDPDKDGIALEILYKDVALATKAGGNILYSGRRYNVTYVNGSVWQIIIGSDTYYFNNTYVKTDSGSSASVGSGSDTKLMTEIKVPAGANLYRSISDYNADPNKDKYTYNLSSDMTLYGIKHDDVWYQVMYGDKSYYVRMDKVTVGPEVAVGGDKEQTATFWVTVGASGATLYKTMNNAVNAPAYTTTLLAGRRILVGNAGGTWYTYATTDGGKAVTAYIHSSQLADSNSESSMSSEKVFFPAGTPLYERKSVTTPEVTLPTSTYYIVRSVDSQWYSINYNEQTYFIQKSAKNNAWTLTVPAGDQIPYYDGTDSVRGHLGGAEATTYTITKLDPSLWNSEVFYGGYGEFVIKKTDVQNAQEGKYESTPIGSTANGKQYYVTIGLGGATLYTTPQLNEAGGSLGAGEVKLATKYTDNLYKIDNAGQVLYLPARDIASIRNGDDASAAKPGENEGDLGEIAKGETNNNFGSYVFDYAIPTGGVWLYTTGATGLVPALNLTKGTIKINELSSDLTIDGVSVNKNSWYTTWHGGTQYFISKASLSQVGGEMPSGTFSLRLSGQTTMYTQEKYSTTVGERYRLVSAGTSSTQNAGTYLNVSVHAYMNATDLTDAKYVDRNPATNRVVKTYKTVLGGTTYYFQPFSGTIDGSDASNPAGFDTVDMDSILAAIVGDKGATGLITKIDTMNPKLHTAARSNSSSTSLSGSVTLYGVSAGTGSWYKVYYNDAVWYFDASTDPAALMEQIAVSGEAESTTYSVVVGSNGASLYTKPNTNAAAMYVGTVRIEPGTLNAYPVSGNTPQALPAGSTVLASVYNGSWYTTSYGDGLTLYFQNNVVVNSTPTSSISSYRIEVPVGVTIKAYATISTNSAANAYEMTLPTDTSYTMRRIDNIWSSTVIAGKTYYVKNADIPRSIMAESTPIGSTSVGKTYQLLLAGSTTVYGESSLKTTKGTLPGGTKISGVKMYDENAANATKLVFKIDYKGSGDGYIDAADVAGVVEGDEVDDGKGAENELIDEYVPVGNTIHVKLNAGTRVYHEMKTGSGVSVYEIVSTATYAITKVNTSWYSMNFLGLTVYIPVSSIEKDASGTGGEGTGGANIGIGQSVNLTITAVVPLYDTTKDGAVQTGSLLPGQTVSVLKVSETWYETRVNNRPLYAKGTDLFSSSTGGGTSEGVTTDGVGIITPTIEVNVTSGKLNLRKTMSTTGTVLATIPKGTVIPNDGYQLDARGQIWYKTSYQGHTGYVSGTFVKAVGTVSGPGTGTGTGGIGDISGDIGKALTVNSVSVNVRSGAGTSYTLVGKMTKGDVIIPTGYSLADDNMYWYKFQYSANQVAYIRYDYVSGGVATTSQFSGNVAIKAGGTNVRSGAGDSFGVKKQLARDTIVTIIGSTTDSAKTLWYNIQVDGVSGYVRHDTVRTLTSAEEAKLYEEILKGYKELKNGSKGTEVTALQQRLIQLGYLAAGQADGIYGTKTAEAVKKFQQANNLTANGVASPATQAAIYNTLPSTGTSGTTKALNWFTDGGEKLLQNNRIISIYDINKGITWTARYINGEYHADVVPNSQADMNKLTANGIIGNYTRRPVIVTIAGQKYAGSMYAVGHGTTNYVSWFSGVMCIHFTNSKTHGSGNVDADHQKAIQDALNSGL